MKQWEYCTPVWNREGNLGPRSVSSLPYDEWLNEMGCAGWELMRVTTIEDNGYFRGHSHVFKREKLLPLFPKEPSK